MVTKSGSDDGTFRYYYDGHKIIEVRDGSGAVVQQLLHGTQYIDELIMVRVKEKGEVYVHQDANWNVIGTTDLGGRVVEHTFLSPYGELTVNQETGFGDPTAMEMWTPRTRAQLARLARELSPAPVASSTWTSTGITTPATQPSSTLFRKATWSAPA